MIMQPDYFILKKTNYCTEKMWPPALFVIKMGHTSEGGLCALAESD